MFLKRKGSTEMFEVFRRQRGTPEAARVADEAEGGESTASTARATGEAESPARTEPVAAPSPFTRLRSNAEPEGMGDRTIIIRYNTALLVLILLVGALFVAFALGVEIGRDRASRDLAFVGTDQDLPSPETRNEEEGPPAFASSESSPVEAEDAHREPAAPAGLSTRHWTIRLVHYAPTRQGKESAERMARWTTARVGSGAYTVTMRIGGESQLAVCYGQFASDGGEDAQLELKRMRGLNDTFRHANLVLVERTSR